MKYEESYPGAFVQRGETCMPAAVWLEGEPLGGLPGGGKRMQLAIPADRVAVLGAHAGRHDAGGLQVEPRRVAHDPSAARAAVGACRAAAVPCAPLQTDARKSCLALLLSGGRISLQTVEEVPENSAVQWNSDGRREVRTDNQAPTVLSDEQN